LKIDPARLDDFRNQFCQLAAEAIAEPAEPELLIDAEVPLGTLTLDTIQRIEELAPFGHGNRRPLFCASEVRLTEPPKPIGGGGRHLAFRFEQHGVRMRGVAFGGADWLEELDRVDGPLDLVYRPMINTFQGARRVELQLTDWRPGATAHPARPRTSVRGSPVRGRRPYGVG
jgi:single-stranded-DNA-specific exonuclease